MSHPSHSWARNQAILAAILFCVLFNSWAPRTNIPRRYRRQPAGPDLGGHPERDRHGHR